MTGRELIKTLLDSDLYDLDDELYVGKGMGPLARVEPAPHPIPDSWRTVLILVPDPSGPPAPDWVQQS